MTVSIIRATLTLVVAREGGRSSIPETPMMESKNRGVLDSPLKPCHRVQPRDTCLVPASVTGRLEEFASRLAVRCPKKSGDGLSGTFATSCD
jgi:hypothetical protein